MPAPYSYDLRKKAVDAYCRGEKKVAICRLMKISRNTLDLWLKGEQATGDFKAIAKRPPKNNRKIQDLERFQKFVRQHQDQTQQQIADKWGENLTQQNVSDG
ncbi:MAG: helix-turn-helix domain-containing protein, partial [Cyanobacteria bacterium J06558_2]